jgi:hypothetical protein
MSDNVTLSGPLFDGRASEWTGEAVAEVRHDVAEHAFDAWQAGMESTFRMNGHVYQGFTQVKDDGDETLVNDGWGENNDLPYGPWLEGLGSRNTPVTRFPGYRNLRNAYAITDRSVPDIAQARIDDLTDRINSE